MKFGNHIGMAFILFESRKWRKRIVDRSDRFISEQKHCGNHHNNLIADFQNSDDLKRKYK